MALTRHGKSNAFPQDDDSSAQHAHDSHYILDGLRAGAKGFILKTHATKDLVRGVRKAAHGESYLSPELSEAVYKLTAANPIFPQIC